MSVSSLPTMMMGNVFYGIRGHITINMRVGVVKELEGGCRAWRIPVVKRTHSKIPIREALKSSPEGRNP